MLFKVSTHRRTVLALVLVAGFVAAGVAALTLPLGPGAASANSGGNGEATFTKWATTCPLCSTTGSFAGADMVGVVGGNVGAGTFSGQVISDSDDGTTWAGHALYHFNGGKHSFTADVHVTQNDVTGIAEITGVVTSGGGLAGAQVTGGYRTMSTCPIPTPGNVLDTVCFKGTLHIDAASAP
jgi:hypothetical protein